MVHKKSHRGVHSGNTLRAFNSRYSRRYHNQACIVSRIRPELLQKLSGGQQDRTAADDKRIASELLISNAAVDVALSLNKHARWLLPSALIRQVESDDIAQSGLTVSVLERHKLKRPASCVSFHSNKGEVKSIRPHNGRYFGFRYPTSNGKSRRALRREVWEERHRKRQKTVADNELEMEMKKIEGRKVEVFTETGHIKAEADLGESEIRYEVFYPSPATSSISHNPKYIKQDVLTPPGQGGEHVQQGKPKRQHRGKQRKRMSLKDIDDCDLPHHYYRQTYASSDQQRDSISIEEDDTTYSEQDDDIAVKHRTTDFLLGSLVEKAERLQSLVSVGVAKSRRRKKSGNTNLSPANSYQQDGKSHIVYLQEDDAQGDQDLEEIESSPQAPMSAIQLATAAAPADSTRVLLPTDDASMVSLRGCFGQGYFEAACKPRKFILDITSNVRELLKKCGIQTKVADCTDDALSYLIFTHDGFYDNEFDVYKILLNSRLHKGLLPVKINVDNQQDLYKGTVMGLISCTMDFLEGFVHQLKEQKHFPWCLKDPNSEASNRQLQLHLGSCEAYVPSVQRVFQLGSDLFDLHTPSLSDLLTEEPTFCDVCYDDITSLTPNSAAATSLLKCEHRVCDSCWSQHIHSRLHQGFVRVTCPGYDCQEDVKVGVLLSLIALDSVEKILQRQEETRVGASSTEKWCPNQSCGRVLRLKPLSAATPPATGPILERQLQQDVLCACGAHVCFQCLCPAHWPASCTQAEQYRRSVATAVFPDRQAEVHEDESISEAKARREEKKTTMMVEGKHCPRCKNFVFKNGGCPQMTCRCGQLFCWFCAKPGYSHPGRGPGCVDEATERKSLTTTIIVRHVDNIKKEEERKKEEQQNVASAPRRQRVSLMERAAEHRQSRLNKDTSKKRVQGITDMAKAVASAAAKDETLARHIIDVCSSGSLPSGSTMPSSSSSISSSSDSTPDSTNTAKPTTMSSVNVKDVVTCFLKRALLSQQELLEVTEYSLVLLKDLPDSLLRRRALRISEDLGTFCTFTHSIFDTWARANVCQGHHQEVVKAVLRLAKIQGWINSALASHVTTTRKLRSTAFDNQ